MRVIRATRMLLLACGFLALLVCCLAPAALAEEPASSASQGDWGKCKWELDASSGTLTVTAGKAGDKPLAEVLGKEDSAKVTSVVMKEGVVSSASSCKELFQGLSKLKSVDISGLDSSAATSFESMFSGCNLLESITGLNKLNTSNSTSFASMFMGCDKLKSIDVSAFDTAKARDMHYMFYKCLALSSITGLGGFNTKQVTLMNGMFAYCRSLTSIDVSYFVTNKVRYFTEMFRGCENLTSIKLTGLNTLKGASFERMFEGCLSLTTLDLSSFDTLSATAANATESMFAGCTALTQLKLGAKVTKLASLPPLNTGQTWRSSSGVHYTTSFADALGKADTYTKSSPASINGASIKLSKTSYTYTGKAIVPGVTVTKNGKTLNKGKDYQLSCAHNTNVGTATVTVTGIYGYNGSVKATFTITPASASDTTVTKIPDQTYTGKANNPSPSVSIGGTTLVKGSDYSVSYSNNVKPGTAKVTITGKGNLTGSKTVTFKTKKASMADAVVTGVANKTYTGKAITQSFTVKLNGTKLRAGTHYTVAYKNNVKPGTASLVITGKGTCYTGTKTVTFKVKKLANTLKASAKAKTLKVSFAKAVKGKGTTSAPVKVSKAIGKLSYKNASTKAAAKKLKVNAKTGKITVPNTAKKGASYSVKVQVTAAGDATHAAASKTITVKVKVV